MQLVLHICLQSKHQYGNEAQPGLNRVSISFSFMVAGQQEDDGMHSSRGNVCRQGHAGY